VEGKGGNEQAKGSAEESNHNAASMAIAAASLYRRGSE
jgi:hypothetical protein